MNLGSRMKLLREGKNMSQKELGEGIGVSDVMISMYEQNKKKPSLSTVIRIADFFDVSTDYLLCKDNQNNNDIPENITAVARDLMDLPEENKKLAIDMIKMMSKRGKEAKQK